MSEPIVDAWTEDERTAQLYQVIGGLAHYADVSNDPAVVRALDLAAYGRTMDGGDVLPFRLPDSSALSKAIQAERAACAQLAENAFGGPAHTYSSENADEYLAQDEACKRIAAAIRSRT